jgi:hypothetical protein
MNLHQISQEFNSKKQDMKLSGTLLHGINGKFGLNSFFE